MLGEGAWGGYLVWGCVVAVRSRVPGVVSISLFVARIGAPVSESEGHRSVGPGGILGFGPVFLWVRWWPRLVASACLREFSSGVIRPVEKNRQVWGRCLAARGGRLK